MTATELSRDVLFTSNTPWLRSIAYGITGSVGEIEDILQEGWISYASAQCDSDTEGSHRSLMATIVSRRALDSLTARHRTHEELVGTWLPEPDLVTRTTSGFDDPYVVAEFNDTVAYYISFLMETLTPRQRTAFVLADLIGLPHGDIARVLNTTPAAARKEASRARKRLAEVQQDPMEEKTPKSGEWSSVAHAFVLAVEQGDLETLCSLLAPNVSLHAEGSAGARVFSHSLHGSENVARVLMHYGERYAAAETVHSIAGNEKNHEFGFVTVGDERSVVVVHTNNRNFVDSVLVQRNPSKLNWEGNSK